MPEIAEIMIKSINHAINLSDHLAISISLNASESDMFNFEFLN